MSSTTRKVAVLAASFLLATSPAFALDESGPGCYDAEVLGKLFKNPISERWGKQICLN